jgi:peptidoglycan-associated lipoprotein
MLSSMVDEELGAMAKDKLMSRGGTLARGATAVAVAALLLLAGCAKDPNAEPGGLALGLAGAGGIGGPGAAAPGSSQDFVANVGDRIFFETDSTDLTTQAKATLDAQAIWLTRYAALRFTIEGHADERGTREYNIALGARRAQNVRDYLVAHGIAATRIQTISYGKERPVAVCNDNTCWSQNRRAVTVLTTAAGT